MRAAGGISGWFAVTEVRSAPLTVPCHLGPTSRHLLPALSRSWPRFVSRLPALSALSSPTSSPPAGPHLFLNVSGAELRAATSQQLGSAASRLAAADTEMLGVDYAQFYPRYS